MGLQAPISDNRGYTAEYHRIVKSIEVNFENAQTGGIRFKVYAYKDQTLRDASGDAAVALTTEFNIPFADMPDMALPQNLVELCYAYLKTLAVFDGALDV